MSRAGKALHDGFKGIYAQIGGSFDAVLSRLCSESFVRKFVLRYKTDPTFEQLKAAVAVKDWESAFRAAHTLKGVAQNLDFGDLGRSAAALTEALRGPKPLEDYSLYESVVQAQTALTNAISALENG